MATGAENVVTGAFGYTGRYITRRLLDLGESVKTLTGHPDRPNPFGERISVAPFEFDRPECLTENLKGVATLYNTYWVRFPFKGISFDVAIANTKTLFKAAHQAGVRRVVHLSITNPSSDSPLPYFRGKAHLEEALRASGLSHAIIRPTVVFGDEDILVNNIAWLVRRSPLFAVPGRGEYRLQPVFVEDLADIAVSLGRRTESTVVDAVGPEVYTFRELVRLIVGVTGSRTRIVSAPARVALLVSRIIGLATGDVVLTRDELAGLMANLLVSIGQPTAPTRFSDWLKAHADVIGQRYVSELRRHYA